MQDSPRDQPTVIAVLCAFARNQSAQTLTSAKSSSLRLPTDIQAALTVVGTRNTANDGSTTIVDFDHALLAHANLSYFHLDAADLTGANLTGAKLGLADFAGADLAGADFIGATLTGPNLIFAPLPTANLAGANLAGAKWPKNVPAPAGWVRDPSSGLLRRVSAGG